MNDVRSFLAQIEQDVSRIGSVKITELPYYGKYTFVDCYGTARYDRDKNGVTYIRKTNHVIINSTRRKNEYPIFRLTISKENNIIQIRVFDFSSHKKFHSSCIFKNKELLKEGKTISANFRVKESLKGISYPDQKTISTILALFDISPRINITIP